MKRKLMVAAFLLTWIVALGAQAMSSPMVMEAPPATTPADPLHSFPLFSTNVDPASRGSGEGPTTEALFDVKLSKGPFPSDWFTVPDPAQNTGRRVNLPQPSCVERPSDCNDLDVINELDGFNLQPRLSIPFDGPIDLGTVKAGVFLIRLGSSLPDGEPGGQVVHINQIVWDTFSNTLHVESDEVLDQHTRYLLVVTKNVLDESGKRIKATTTFLNFVDDSITESTGDPALDAYRELLRGALRQVDGIVVPRGQVVAASVFTTQSATAILEKIRDQIHEATPDPADFLLGPNNARTVFSLDAIAGITWNQQKSVDVNAALTSVSVAELSLLRTTYPGAVGSIAFGKYVSPDYEVHPGEYIPAVETRSGTPEVKKWSDIYFNLFLPSGPKPANGWPVAIFAHGIGASKDVNPVYSVVSSLAKYGIATIAINNVGHGYGPQSTLTVSRTDGAPMTFTAGGRAVDQNHDNKYGGNEGVSAAGPKAIVFFSDGYRQTAADLMQLVRVVEVGMDVDGDGERDLDASRIYFFSQSLGGGIGTVFVSVEPDVRVGVLTVPIDIVPIGGLSCIYRGTEGGLLATRQPPLLNFPGITSLDGCPLSKPFFNENFPLRDETPLTVQLSDGTTSIIQSPVTNTVGGAMAIQEGVENLKWVGQAGSPLAYAPHLRKAPLDGVPAKSVLVLTAKGDQSAANPTTTAIVRAGDLADRTLYYRHDLYRADNPNFPLANPHGFATNLLFGEIALSVQDMVGKFFSSDGALLTAPQPSKYFEFPILLPLPESLNYLP